MRPSSILSFFHTLPFVSCLAAREMHCSRSATSALCACWLFRVCASVLCADFSAPGPLSSAPFITLCWPAPGHASSPPAQLSGITQCVSCWSVERATVRPTSASHTVTRLVDGRTTRATTALLSCCSHLHSCGSMRCMNGVVDQPNVTCCYIGCCRCAVSFCRWYCASSCAELVSWTRSLHVSRGKRRTQPWANQCRTIK